MTDDDKAHKLEIELVKLQGRFKGIEKRADNLEDVVSNLSTKLVEANESLDDALKTVQNLKHKLTLVAVSVLTFVATSAPEVFGVIARIMGLL